MAERERGGADETQILDSRSHIESVPTWVSFGVRDKKFSNNP
jgi:hypothetical protein